MQGINAEPFTIQYKSVSLQPDKRSVTQETEEAEKQCIAFASRILQKKAKRNGTTLSLTG